MMNKERELLKRAKNNLHGAKLCSVNSMSSRAEMLRLMDEAIKGIDEFLASEPESDEPVAWIIGYQTITGDIGKKLSWSKSGAEVCNRLQGEEYETPLYLHPAEPEKKPMTQEEIDKGFSLDWFYGSFVEGIRFAEKYHGIGEKDD